MRNGRSVSAALALTLTSLGAASLALAQPAPSPAPAKAQAAPELSKPAPADKPAEERKDAGPKLTFSGYVESYYGYNFNTPSNGITNLHAYDGRHDSFGLQNVQLETSATMGAFVARVGLQIGATPASYYIPEPVFGGTPTVPTNSGDLWRYIQQANVAWTAPVGRGLQIAAGIFMAPVGPEGLAIKDNWNWSLSFPSLVFPNYQTGISLTYPLTDTLSLSIGAFNGWDSVVDGNADKSLQLILAYKLPDRAHDMKVEEVDGVVVFMLSVSLTHLQTEAPWTSHRGVERNWKRAGRGYGRRWRPRARCGLVRWCSTTANAASRIATVQRGGRRDMGRVGSLRGRSAGGR